jgi:hypothetical protein
MPFELWEESISSMKLPVHAVTQLIAGVRRTRSEGEPAVIQHSGRLLLLTLAIVGGPSCDVFNGAFGSVRSPSGEPIEDATVVVECGGVTFTEHTDAEGRYNVTKSSGWALRTRITVTKAGFEPYVIELPKRPPRPRVDIVLTPAK